MPEYKQSMKVRHNNTFFVRCSQTPKIPNRFSLRSYTHQFRKSRIRGTLWFNVLAHNCRFETRKWKVWLQISLDKTVDFIWLGPFQHSIGEVNVELLGFIFSLLAWVKIFVLIFKLQYAASCCPCICFESLIGRH